jgi:hypothetical protein
VTEKQTWRPLGAEPQQFDVLVDGVPSHMATSLWSWVRFELSYSNRNGSRYFDRGKLRQLERTCRFTCDYDSYDLDRGIAALRAVAEYEAIELRIVDGILALNVSGTRSSELETLLEQSGSKWRVGTRYGRPGLVRRIAEAVQQSAERAFTTDAGSNLQKAWQALYGIDPDPSQSYSLSVKAVEDAAIPVVTPNQSLPTLGHVVGELGSGAWRIVDASPTRVDTGYLVRDLCNLVWSGHRDRHGGTPDRGPISYQEAEAVLHAAVALVHWFTVGLVGRR